MKKLALIALAVALSTTAQAQETPPEQIAIRAYLDRTAFDPGSVQIRSFTPARQITWGGGFLGGPKRTAIISCATWNAKNRYGGYVGFITDAFVLNETRTEVIDMYDEGRNLGFDLCATPTIKGPGSYEPGPSYARLRA